MQNQEIQYRHKYHTGSFEISEITLQKFISTTERYFPINKLTITLSFFGGEKRIVNSLEHLEKLPVGNRKKIAKLSILLIPVTEEGTTTHDHEWVKITFTLRSSELHIYTGSKTRAPELLNAVDSIIPNFKNWYSPLYHPLTLPIHSIIMFCIWIFVSIALIPLPNWVGNSTPLFICFMGFIHLAPLSLYFMFDSIVFNFEAGRKRETFKQNLRKYVFGGLSSISIVTLCWRFLG